MKSALKFTATAVIIILLTSLSLTSDEHSIQNNSKVNVTEILLDGNKRFVEGTLIHPHQDFKTITENSKGQKPFAIIITCSDSRVPVETIFDQGIGDIFVIRVAGNIIGSFELGSIQYAVEHLNVKFIGIMGHTDCGAIKAYAKNSECTSEIKSIITHIAKETEEIQIPSPKQEHLKECIYANIFHGYKQILNDKLILNESKENGKITILPMIYDVETGIVKIIEQGTVKLPELKH